MAEKKLINFTKDKLLDACFTVKTRYDTTGNAYTFDFILSGAGSLIFNGENPELVNTIDVDLKMWFIKGHSYKSYASHNAFITVFKAIMDVMWSNLETYNKMSVKYLRSLYPDYKLVSGRNHYTNYNNILEGFELVNLDDLKVMRMRFMGFDLLDLSLQDIPNKDSYYKLPITIYRHDYLLNIVTPNYLYHNHISMLQFHASRGMKEFINIKAITNFQNTMKFNSQYIPFRVVNDNNTLNIINSVPTTYDEAIMIEWMKFFYDTFLFWNLKNLNDPKLLRSYQTNELIQYSQRFGNTFLTEYYNYNEARNTFYTSNYPQKFRRNDGRIPKTAKRLYIMLYYFDIQFNTGTCPFKLKYKPHRSSCNTKAITTCFDLNAYNTANECVAYLGPGSHPNNIGYIDRYLQSTVGSGGLTSSNRPCSQKYTIYSHFKSVPVSQKFDNLTDTEVLCVWSVDSANFTNDLRDLYFGKLLGDTTATNELATTFKNRLLQIIHKNTLSADVEVYRATVNKVYINGLTDFDLKVGDIFTQYTFMSATYDPNFDQFPHFAVSATETAIYVIRLRKGNHVAYIGSDPQRTAYTKEYELLLPPGILLRVADISYRYISGNKMLYRYKVYTLDYDESPFINGTDFSGPFATHPSQLDDADAFTNVFISSILNNIYNNIAMKNIFTRAYNGAITFSVGLKDLLYELFKRLYPLVSKIIFTVLYVSLKVIAGTTWGIAAIADLLTKKINWAAEAVKP